MPFPDPEKVYFIDESFINNSRFSVQEQQEIINKLRKYSIDKRYCKVSTHADDIIYDFISDKIRNNTELSKQKQQP